MRDKFANCGHSPNHSSRLEPTRSGCCRGALQIKRATTPQNARVPHHRARIQEDTKHSGRKTRTFCASRETSHGRLTKRRLSRKRPRRARAPASLQAHGCGRRASGEVICAEWSRVSAIASRARRADGASASRESSSPINNPQISRPYRGCSTTTAALKYITKWTKNNKSPFKFLTHEIRTGGIRNG